MEKTTKTILRTSEFFWQEGHTAHATEEAEARTVQMLNMYADFCEQYLAIPVVKDRRQRKRNSQVHIPHIRLTLMHDGKALQSGTNHNFGDGFAKAFDIQYTDKDNKLQYVHPDIMGNVYTYHWSDHHGSEMISGLVLPQESLSTDNDRTDHTQKKEGVLDKAEEIERTCFFLQSKS